MRNYEQETTDRAMFIRNALSEARADGIVFGNSGGKDSALVGILCKMACEDTLGIIMPCESTQNYAADKSDAETLAAQFSIETRTVDLTATKKSLTDALCGQAQITDAARANIAPRLRMATLYAVAASEGRLVVGTGNRSEGYMGYFTKWGDGAFDINPIADLTVTEIYEFLRFLNAPEQIIEKAPSAGLFEGQTDEREMGISYRSIDEYLLCGTTNPRDMIVIDRYHRASNHKRTLPKTFSH